MNFEPSGIYHIYNRGHNRQPIFFGPHNYDYFLKKVKKHFLPYCDVICYCLMPNHFHFLVQVCDDYPTPLAPEDHLSNVVKLSPFSQEFVFNNSIGKMISSYAQAINKQEKRIGALFQEKTKAKNLYDGLNYMEHRDVLSITPIVRCFSYIHNNPVAAKIVRSPELWEYSSFKEYLGLRRNGICNKRLFFDLIGGMG